LKIYIAGDSMAGIPGMALTNLARDTGVMKARLDYRVSSGLCRPDFFDWPAQLARQVYAYHPPAAVLMFGANDRQGVQPPSGKVYQFESAGWKKEYRRRVDDVIGELFDGGVRRIYWVGQPIMPDRAFSRQMQVINDIYKKAAKAHPGVHYVDAYGLFGNGSGVYAAISRTIGAASSRSARATAPTSPTPAGYGWPKPCWRASTLTGCRRSDRRRKRRRRPPGPALRDEDRATPGPLALRWSASSTYIAPQCIVLLCKLARRLLVPRDR